MNFSRKRLENIQDSVEDVLLAQAAEGNFAAEQILDRPFLMRRLVLRVRRSQWFFGNLGDGTILDSFERLVEFLLEHADEIIALIMKIIPLFLGEELMPSGPGTYGSKVGRPKKKVSTNARRKTAGTKGRKPGRPAKKK